MEKNTQDKNCIDRTLHATHSQGTAVVGLVNVRNGGGVRFARRAMFLHVSVTLGAKTWAIMSSECFISSPAERTFINFA